MEHIYAMSRSMVRVAMGRDIRILESFAAEDELPLTILKTIGILNLLNDSDLLPYTE